MAYQETRTVGYGSRVGSSFKGIGAGFMLFLAGTALLWWNEGRAVKTEKMLDEAASNYVEMENPNKKDASLDGELICGTAMATTEDSLTDAQFGIGAKAIAIKRKVEYYQWVEHAHEASEDKLGGKQVTTTTYTYSKEWVGQPVESAQFKDPAYQKKNLVLTTFENAEQYAENVKFGAYTLNESLIHSISSKEPMELALSEDLLKQFDKSAQTAYERFYGVVKKQPAEQQAQQPAQQPAAIPDSVRALLSDSAKAVVDSIKAVMDSIQAANASLIANAENKKELEYVHQGNNLLYFGRVPGSPEVGDVRVTFEKIVPAKVTVMAVVDGDGFKPYKAKNGKRFQTLVMGKKSGDEIIDAEKEANHTWLWIFRFFGVMMVIGGLKGIFDFVVTILKVVPFVANIVGWGIGVVCTVIGVAWSLIVIAIAWLFYRPVLAITLLAIAGFLVWVFAFKGKDKLKEMASKYGQPKAGTVPLLIFALGLSAQQANAQFGNILNRIEYSAKSKVENAAVNAAEKAGKNVLDSAKKKAKKAKKDKAEAETWTYGEHTYTMKGNLTADKYRKDGFGEVTFTNIPSDYHEFEALYSEFLGRTPHGTAAMIPMAMEMYARDREIGKKCIELLSYPSNVNSIISRLKDKFGSDESYGQRYLPAAVLEGATAANGYKPNRPYTVTMEASVNKHQELQIVGEGTVMYIYVIGGGWDTAQRQVEIILEPGHEQYQVFNCPSLYTGCRQIRGTWGGLE